MGDAIHIESAALRVRHERLARLRAAWRALAPSIMAKETGEADQTVRELRGRIGELAERSEDASEAELTSLDEALERYAQSLRVSLDQVSVAQLRSTLPDVESSQRGEVLALLDLVLEDEAHLRKRMAVADYLITLLSTEEQGNRRRIMHDPVGLTARLNALSERLATGMTRDLEGAEQGFFAAVRRLEEGDMDRVLREARTLKNGLGLNLLLPEVLRGLVFYNTSFWNRIRSQIEEDRASAGDDADLPAELAAVAAEEPESAFDAPAREAASSVFEAKGLRAVAQALARWAVGEELGNTPAERVAVRLDLASLSPAEHSALSSAGGGMGGDAARDALVLTLVVGLVLRSLPLVRGDLAALRIDPTHLQCDWLRELDAALRKAMAGLIAGNGYAVARRLSEARSRYLFAPLSELNREARAARAAAQEPAEIPAATPDGKAGERTELPGEAPPGPRSRGARGRREARGAEGGGKRRFLAQLAALALVAAVGIGAFVWKIRPSAGSVRTLSRHQLQLVSTELHSGYRDHHGHGPLFVGTVDTSWKGLSQAERQEKAQEMVKHLRQEGVRRVMLFDSQHRLEVEYNDGQPVEVLR